MICHKEYWDDVPPLGRTGRRWLRRRLYLETQYWLQKQTKVDPEDPENGQFVKTLVSELAAEPLSVLRWVDAEEFSGRGFSSGDYVLDLEDVARLLPELFAAWHSALTLRIFPTSTSGSTPCSATSSTRQALRSQAARPCSNNRGPASAAVADQSLPSIATTQSAAPVAAPAGLLPRRGQNEAIQAAHLLARTGRGPARLR